MKDFTDRYYILIFLFSGQKKETLQLQKDPNPPDSLSVSVHTIISSPLMFGRGQI